ncbi:MAG: 1-(5-phosphoribosyl)-5-((5-phosphoribosylamino)methylideneamino)imidazole-4-carboxamide isomerase [Gammaproteobacteria bacterium]|nr:1-(5-phosphoribosyl)-5-((5-phosphoribosylamino)methylideneamino)imidazole-4-carboxamide isomerase [Gammaproteobacteria bacterium]
MIIYPDIEIHQGKCVNLKHGSISKPTVFDISPLDAAKQFENDGAEWLHIIDLDRVFDNEHDNRDLIRNIIKQAYFPVQIGGGLSSQTAIEHWFDDGAERVVLGTAAVTDQKLVFDVCAHHPEKVVISIDARGGKVVTHGWETESSFSALDLAKHFEAVGAGGIIYTDIDLYDELPESSMANTIEMASQLSCPVISSGTIRTLDDVSMLSQLPNVSGVVIGWALFNEKVALADALAVARQKRTEAAFI